MKPLNIFSTSLLLLLCGSTVSCGQVLLPDAKVTVRVLDENKQPLEGADASVGFEVIAPRSFESKSEGRHGLTGADGLFTASNPTVGLIFYGARKAGYYDTTGPEYRFTGEELRRWQPYNVGFDVVLKKIVNPVPMYAKRAEVLFPLEGWPVGFDLMVGDWVAPYGTGTTADFVFHVDRTFRGLGNYDTTVALGFSNLGDGIQEVFASPRSGSALRLDHLAPDAGYLPKWSMSVHKVPGSSVIQDERGDRNYYFRVRTVMRDGKIISALYGKIHGDFQLGGFAVEKVGAVFTYYLNPDGTRNLEFDPAHNLFVHLPALYKPNDP